MKTPSHRRFQHKGFPSKSSVIESNGPQGKIRGTAQQLLERYMILARDARREGDNVLSENFFQHAEHYRRIVAEYPAPKPKSFEEGLTEAIPETSDDTPLDDTIIVELDDDVSS